MHRCHVFHPPFPLPLRFSQALLSGGSPRPVSTSQRPTGWSIPDRTTTALRPHVAPGGIVSSTAAPSHTLEFANLEARLAALKQGSDRQRAVAGKQAPMTDADLARRFHAVTGSAPVGYERSVVHPPAHASAQPTHDTPGTSTVPSHLHNHHSHVVTAPDAVPPHAPILDAADTILACARDELALDPTPDRSGGSDTHPDAQVAALLAAADAKHTARENTSGAPESADAAEAQLLSEASALLRDIDDAAAAAPPPGTAMSPNTASPNTSGDLRAHNLASAAITSEDSPVDQDNTPDADAPASVRAAAAALASAEAALGMQGSGSRRESTSSHEENTDEALLPGPGVLATACMACTAHLLERRCTMDTPTHYSDAP
eukprot:m.796283 g.796283  ORF g.796283 m.796283 type:complete len:375 (+) comp23341_c0_seq97:186-1310(+)